MYIIILTHADAAKVEPRHVFRPLSSKGKSETKALASRFKEVIKNHIPEIGDAVSIGEIITSPLARCVETIIQFAAEINQFTNTSEIQLANQLKEKREGRLTKGDIVSVLDSTHSKVVLLCVHGDLAGAMPGSAKLKSEYVDKDIWFKGRPVWTIIKFTPRSPKHKWDNAEVLLCELLEINQWVSIFE